MTTNPTDDRRERIADALTAAAFECDGKCGLSEQECWDRHPIHLSAVSNGIPHMIASVTAIAEVVLAVLPSAAVPPPTDRAAVWLDAAAECDKAGGDYAARGNDAAAGAAFSLMEAFLRKAGEAEYAATPCTVPNVCEDGGEPCDAHERILGHIEGYHDLCAPDCGQEWLRRVAAEAQQQDCPQCGTAGACNGGPCPLLDGAGAQQQEPTAHGCTINGQPAMPILVAEYNQLVTRAAEAEAQQQPDRVAAYRLAGSRGVHCPKCTPSPAGDIWTPVTAEELDQGGVCTVCGVDLLLQPDTKVCCLCRLPITGRVVSVGGKAEGPHVHVDRAACRAAEQAAADSQEQP